MFAGLQRLNHIAARKHEPGDHALAVGSDLQPGGQRIGHAHAHPVQSAREAVGAALALVKLAARMQASEHQLNHRGILGGVHAKWNAPAVVFNADGAIGLQDHLDLFAVPGQGLIGRVVQHLLNDVQGVVRARVHAGALLDGLQALEHADGVFGIFGGGFDSHSRRF